MKLFDSENIVKFEESFEDENYIYIVMEYCDQGNLYYYVLTEKPKEKKCIEIFVQILRGFR